MNEKYELQYVLTDKELMAMSSALPVQEAMMEWVASSMKPITKNYRVVDIVANRDNARYRAVYNIIVEATLPAVPRKPRASKPIAPAKGEKLSLYAGIPD